MRELGFDQDLPDGTALIFLFNSAKKRGNSELQGDRGWSGRQFLQRWEP